MNQSCLEKQKAVKEIFAGCATREEIYQKIIELGRKSAPLNPLYKIPQNLVRGCQSALYLHSYEKNDLILFEAESDALISSGLAMLLLMVYNEEPPEVVLT